MGIGVSIFLIAAGAILAFAVNANVPNVNLVMVGIILMCAGAVGLIVTMVMWAPRRGPSPGPDAYADRRPYRDPGYREPGYREPGYPDTEADPRYGAYRDREY